MKLLLDTHILLWWLDDPMRISQESRDAISVKTNDVLVSAVVIWEIGIKQGLAKLKIRPDLFDCIRQSGFAHLDVTHHHAWKVRDLPPCHRDPFDRMLVAQCMVEQATLVTRDDAVRQYGIPILLA